LTAYLDYHPGGSEILMKYAGQDISAPFGKTLENFIQLIFHR
jgi:cytochrome b involved in lipid metabolism